MSEADQVKVPKAINNKVLFYVGKLTRYLLKQGKGFSVSFNDDATVEEEEGFRKVEGNSISIGIDDPVSYNDLAEFLDRQGFMAVNGVVNNVADYIEFHQSLFQEEWEKTIYEKEKGGRRKVVRIMVVLKGVTTNGKSSVDRIIIYPKILLWY